MSNWYTRRYRETFRIPIITFLLLIPFPLMSQVEIPIVVSLQGGTTGEVTARLPEADLNRAELLSLMRPFLNEESYGTIASADGDYLSVDVLRNMGIQADFDEELLTMAIRVPPRLMPESLIRLREARGAIDPGEITSAPFSAYLNYSAVSSLLYERFTEAEEFSIPSRLTLAPAFQLYRWVLEGNFIFRTDPEPLAELETLRMVRDFPAAGLRLAAGTLDSSMDGISIGTRAVLRNIGGNPIPSFNRIIVEEISIVEIYLNGRLLKRLRLQPGIHTLSDIPYSGGLNTVRVVIIRQDGTTKVYESTQPFDSRLLPEGTYDFTCSAGTPRSSFSDPMLTGSFSYGLLDSISAGLSGETDFSDTIGSFHTVGATPAGNIGADVSAFTSGGAAPALYGALRYRLSFPGSRKAPVIALGFEYSDEEYKSSLLQESSGSYRYTASATWGQVLPFSSYLGLGASWRFNDGFGDGSGKVSATLLSNLNRSTSISLNSGTEFFPDAPAVWQASITISINPEPAGTTTMFSQNLGSGETSASISSSAWNLSLSGYPPAADERTSLEASAALRPESFNLSLSSSLSSEGDGSFVHRTGAGMAGALLFAGGRFALTPPVSDSFALIIPDAGLDEQALRVSGSGITAQEATGKVLSLHELSSYREVGISLDLPEADPDTVLSDERLSILPSYRSGTIIRPSMRKSIYGSGMLVNLDGDAVPLRAAEIITLSQEPGEESCIIFSDERGMFQFHDLKPGSYLLTLVSNRRAQVEFTIPEESVNPADIGSLTLPILEKE
jgi:outer membrane usher protein